MILRKLTLLILGGFLIGLLAGCGDQTTPIVGNPTNSASPPATPPALTNVVAVVTTLAATTNQNPTVSSKATVTGVTLTPPAGVTSVIDPCNLFTKADFMDVFGKEASDPYHLAGVTSEKCNFSFAVSPDPSVNTEFGLEVEVLNGTFTKQSFDKRLGVLLSGTQNVDGVADVAYYLPTASADGAASLFVLKGQTGFSLNLLEPFSVTNAQRIPLLKAAAAKVLGHLTAPLPTATSAPVGTTAPVVNQKITHDACTLFTRADYTALFSDQASEPDKGEDVANYSCAFQSSATLDQIGLYLEKENYTKTYFDSKWGKQAYSKVEPVAGVGDDAFWTEGSVSRIYVLKGSTAFFLELSLQNDATPQQKLDLLKAAAQKVLARL